MSEMKLIMENWRGYKNNILLEAPMTIPMFKQIVKAAIDYKKLELAGHLGGEIGTRAMKGAVNQFTGGLSGTFTDTAAVLYKTGKMGQLALASGRLPDDETEGSPFMDIFNIDDKYSKLLDDRLETAFLNHLADAIDNDEFDNVDLSTWDINQYLETWLGGNFDTRSVQGGEAKRVDFSKAQAALSKLKKVGFFQGLKTAALAAAGEK